MNYFAVVFNLICIGIVLLALAAAAISFIAGKAKKNMGIFHKTVEVMDFLLLLYEGVLFLMIIASVSAIMIIINKELVDPSGFIIPMFLFLIVFCYLFARDVRFGSIRKLFQASSKMEINKIDKKQGK